MKVKLEWDESRDRYVGKYLGFELDCNDNYTIVSGGEKIGAIEKIRVGAWQHWCILLEEGCYLSPGCNDEAREMQRILGSKKKNILDVAAEKMGYDDINHFLKKDSSPKTKETK